MGPQRRTTNEPPKSPYPAPPPADYSDEVTDAHLAALAESVADEIDDGEIEIVSGPAW